MQVDKCPAWTCRRTIDVKWFTTWWKRCSWWTFSGTNDLQTLSSNKKTRIAFVISLNKRDWVDLKKKSVEKLGTSGLIISFIQSRIPNWLHLMVIFKIIFGNHDNEAMIIALFKRLFYKCRYFLIHRYLSTFKVGQSGNKKSFIPISLTFNFISIK